MLDMSRERGIKALKKWGSTMSSKPPPDSSESHGQLKEDETRVLFVDEKTSERVAFAQLLQASGIPCDSVRTESEASAQGAKHRYALIALDLDKDQQSTEKIVEGLRKLQPEASYLFVAGNLDRPLPDTLRGAACSVDLIEKPFGRKEVLSAIERVRTIPEDSLLEEGNDNPTPPGPNGATQGSDTGGSVGFALLALLKEVEELGCFTGQISFQVSDGEHMLGHAVVVQGQLCLVRGTRNHAPLGQLLSQRYPETRAHIRGALQRAKSRRCTIGQALTEMGVVSRSQVRSALRKQAVLGLKEIARGPQKWVLVTTPLQVPSSPTGSDILAFSLSELYFSAMRPSARRSVDWATRLFEAFVDVADQGILCSRWEERCLPLEAKLEQGETIHSLIQLCNGAALLSDPPALRAAGIQPIVMAAGTPKDGGIIASSPSRCALLGGIDAFVRARIYNYVAELRAMEAFQGRS